MTELECKHRDSRNVWLGCAVVTFIIAIIGDFVGFGAWNPGAGWLFFAALAAYDHGWLKGAARQRKETDGTDPSEPVRLP